MISMLAQLGAIVRINDKKRARAERDAARTSQTAENKRQRALNAQKLIVEKTKTREQAICDYLRLKKRRAYALEIARDLGITKDSARNTLRRLVARGIVMIDGHSGQRTIFKLAPKRKS